MFFSKEKCQGIVIIALSVYKNFKVIPEEPRQTLAVFLYYTVINHVHVLNVIFVNLCLIHYLSKKTPKTQHFTTFINELANV